MAAKKSPAKTEDRRNTGQSVPLGDTGSPDTGVRKDQQGISNRPGDEDENEQNRDEDEDEDEVIDDEQEEEEEEEEESEPTFQR